MFKFVVGSASALFDGYSVSSGPEVTRAEVRVLWELPAMHHDARGETVNYYEFLRAFSENKLLAFPNAKRAPPRHGDADLIMRSLRLNADTDLVREELRTKVGPKSQLSFNTPASRVCQ